MKYREFWCSKNWKDLRLFAKDLNFMKFNLKTSKFIKIKKLKAKLMNLKRLNIKYCLQSEQTSIKMIPISLLWLRIKYVYIAELLEIYKKYLKIYRTQGPIQKLNLLPWILTIARLFWGMPMELWDAWICLIVSKFRHLLTKMTNNFCRKERKTISKVNTKKYCRFKFWKDFKINQYINFIKIKKLEILKIIQMLL